MFAPTACTTPTRLPTLMWTLAATLLLLSVFAPAFAAQTPANVDASPAPQTRWTVALDGSAPNVRGLYDE